MSAHKYLRLKQVKTEIKNGNKDFFPGFVLFFRFDARIGLSFEQNKFYNNIERFTMERIPFEI
ncbi:MAG: hypothetical protein COT17_07050 [Elusimicrobia bacterium CG08_land_8_20_14_0_20_51_18]|nr:MAG: hypothetical protein COT17_07050 [Elusimicrobia bacterium CG08_land_8_20_14_0_20_51_18]